MTSTKRKIAATALAIMLAASTALGLFVSDATAATDMGGAYNSAHVISGSILRALQDAANARQNEGDPIAWLNIRKHGYEVNSASGGSWGGFWDGAIRFSPDNYGACASEGADAACDIELTYPNAGYISTTGQVVDLHVKAHLWAQYDKNRAGVAGRNWTPIDLNPSNLGCDGGGPGYAGIQFSMWVTKKGTSTRVNAYIPMLWGGHRPEHRAGRVRRRGGRRHHVVCH